VSSYTSSDRDTQMIVLTRSEATFVVLDYFEDFTTMFALDNGSFTGFCTSAIHVL
jgi:hypothetical protein